MLLKVTTTLLLVIILNLAVTDGQKISISLYDAIRKVETGGVRDPLNAVGDKGKSIGPYQIQEGYYNDAVQKDPSLRDNGKTYQNCAGEGSMEYSERVMQAYMNRYATPSRLGRTPTDEDIARIHNGGPNGYKKCATVNYWKKVKKHL